MQEIGNAVGHDKKTDKKQASRMAIEFLLHYMPPAATSSGPRAAGNPPQGLDANSSEPSTSGYFCSYSMHAFVCLSVQLSIRPTTHIYAFNHSFM